MQAIVVSEVVCPKCDALFPAEYEQCVQCGAALIAEPELEAISVSGDRTLNKPWVIVVMVLHVGLLGIPVYWRLNYSKSTRWMIIIASVLYTIFALVAIVWMSYSIIQMFSNA